MNWLQALILGIVQGLTEFLPVSSSGHLEITKSLFGVDPEASFFFTIAVHGATVLSTLIVFRKEIVSLINGFFKFRKSEEMTYTLKLLFSMIPVMITGLLLKKPIESLFNENLFFIGLMLLATSLILTLAHFVKKRERDITFKDALIIGLAQAVSVIPGISRSGSTIATGLLIGNKKDEIAKFSFLMVLLPVLGANFLEIVSGDAAKNTVGFGVILIGFIAAFISGYLACKWMITLVRRSKLIWFAIYCALIGSLSIFLG
jgi:undecaprenyl-diphosphatase